MSSALSANERVRNALSRALDVPGDTISDLPILHVTGACEAMIENHKGIQKFNSEELILYSSIGSIRITGKKLKILNINSHELILTGIIESVQYAP